MECIFVPGVISITGGRLGRHLKYTGVMPGLPRWQTLDLETTDQEEQFDT